jgi:LemA protein
MELSTLFYASILLVVLLYYWYASIISKKNRCYEALSGVDVQLQKRLELIPNILVIAKKFMEHETELMTDLTKLREKVGQNYDKQDTSAVKQHFTDAEQLSQTMGNFILKAENYPNLKSDQTMIQAQQSYNEVESQIAAARRFYNSSATELKNATQIFPGNLIAKAIGVSEMPFYQAEEQAKKPINAKDFL